MQKAGPNRPRSAKIRTMRQDGPFGSHSILLETALEAIDMIGICSRRMMQCRKISISPTMDEALSAGREDITAYLPAYHAGASHHLPNDDMDRGLDICFRLLRHDNFQPLFKNVQGLLKERSAGANLCSQSLTLPMEDLKHFLGQWGAADQACLAWPHAGRV